MAVQNDVGVKTFIAGAAIGAGIRVKLNGGKLAVAALADRDIGVTTQAAFADGDVVAVALTSKPGTARVQCAGAVTVGAAVYTAASGKVSVTNATGSYARGIALSAATDGEIEILQDQGHTAKA